MRRLLKRAGGVAALGLGATLLPLLAAAPASAAPGAQPAPTVSPNPVATNATTFSLSNGTCDGTGGAGWRVQTYVLNVGVDPLTLAFDQGVGSSQVGTDQDASNGSIQAPLYKGNAPGTGFNPAASPAGLINPSDLSGFSFSAAGWNLPDGPYQIGYACINDVGTPVQNWSQTVTIDSGAPAFPGNAFLFQGLAPGAPVIDTVAPSSGALTIDFHGVAPAATNWTAQASTVADFSVLAGTSTTVTADTSNIVVSGLTNGTPYFVRVLATKPGVTVPSASATGTPGANGGAVQNLAVTASGVGGGAGQPATPFVDVDWNAPAAVSGCTVSSYNVTTSAAGATVTQPDPNPTGSGTGGSARVTPIPTNTTVTVTVMPVFNVGCSGTAASISTTVNSGGVVIQDIDVTRPIGALVLTQICGANGALPAEGAGAPATFGGTDTAAASGNFPGTRDDQVLTTPVIGFDRNGGLPAVPAVSSSTVTAPSSAANGGPSLSPNDPPGGVNANVDPNYTQGEYPYPVDANGVAAPAAETHCGLDLGVARFVTQGAGAGQYFSASAAMNQVTIVDTRNVDAGWTVTGKMSDFTATTEASDGSGPTGSLDSFSGDFLGWTPVVTADTPAFDSDANGTPDYNQAVVAGARVAPGTDHGLGLDATFEGETLATAAAGSGLGTSILDARIKLLIPVTADAGSYEGTLTFSVV